MTKTTVSIIIVIQFYMVGVKYKLIPSLNKEIYYVDLFGRFSCPTAKTEKQLGNNQCEFTECHWEEKGITLILFRCPKLIPHVTCLSYDESGFNKNYCTEEIQF